MMSIERRKEHAELHKDLVDLLTDCEDDTDYYRRLLWAKEIINNCLADFDD